MVRCEVRLQERRAAALAGRSPRAVGAAKDRAALTWVYAWGWSSASVIDAHASPGRRGVAARLVRRGLMTATPSPAGRGIRGAPAEVLTLTPEGVAEVEAVLPADALIPYPAQANRLIPWHQLRHDSLVQLWTARRLRDGTITGYVTPRQMAGPSVAGQKQPDACWHWPHIGAVAVELELTAKREREQAQAALALLRAIQPKTGHYNAAVILSHSDAILARWRATLRPGETLPTYERDASRHWRRAGGLKVPEWVRERVILQRIDL